MNIVSLSKYFWILYFSSLSFVIAPSDAPLDVTGQVVDSTTVSLSWSPPLPENQNGVIRKYIIAATETDTGNVYTWESISTNIGIHSLHPFYTYQFTVAAYTIERGPFSYIVTLQTPEDGKIMYCLLVVSCITNVHFV